MLKRYGYILLAFIVMLNLAGCSKKERTPEQIKNEQAINAAFNLCDVLENTKVITQCEISGFSRAINFRVDSTGSEARTICQQIKSMESSQALKNRWSINIYSPFSGEHPIATCRF